VKYDTHSRFLLNVFQQLDNFLLHVTSKAVVGSSAINNCGLQAIAIAIMTRFFVHLKSHEGIYRILFLDQAILLSNSESVSLLVSDVDKSVCCNRFPVLENHKRWI
jgi:hypothetical protein